MVRASKHGKRPFPNRSYVGICMLTQGVVLYHGSQILPTVRHRLGLKVRSGDHKMFC